MVPSLSLLQRIMQDEPFSSTSPMMMELLQNEQRAAMLKVWLKLASNECGLLPISSRELLCFSAPPPYFPLSHITTFTNGRR